MSKELKQKCMAAIVSYVQQKGYEVLDSSEAKHGFMVAKDGDALVFIDMKAAESSDDPIARDGGFRAEMEGKAVRWLADCEAEPAQVRFDAVDVTVISGDRALLKHHINCLGC